MASPNSSPFPDLNRWLRTLREQAESCDWEVEEIGQSNGYPLLAFTRSAERLEAPSIYISAGIHGDEPSGPLAAARLIAEDLLGREAHFTILPLLNPTGAIAGTRENHAGIDLNRNYREPSQPEVRSHVTFLKRRPPNDLFLSLHEDWETSGFYVYEINTSGDPPLHNEILAAAKQILPIAKETDIDGHRVNPPGCIQHDPKPDEPRNWPEAIYHLNHYPHLSYTLETPSGHGFALPRRIEAHCATALAAIRAFLKPK